MHKVSCWLVGFFINHHLYLLIASLYSYINLRRNLELMDILTLPFPSHEKTLSSKEYYWERALQPSEWEVRGAEGYKRLWHRQVSFVGILF